MKTKPFSVSACSLLIVVALLSLCSYKACPKSTNGDAQNETIVGNSDIVGALDSESTGMAQSHVFSNVPSEQATKGSTNHHDWVDLGLSVKWATCNVGASSPSGYGDYFAWGETHTKGTNASYQWDNYKWFIGSLSPTYICSKYGTADNKTCLEISDDAASDNWGEPWRMPTDAEWTELRTKSTWTWTNGGYKVTGPNGNSIFLPAAGTAYRYEAGSTGYYWSSSLDTGDPNCAWDVIIDSDSVIRGSTIRCSGKSVRPVTE